jgi:putative hydrolase of the HAD superfamily
MPKLIIFDIGGVIEDFAEQRYVDYICRRLHLDKKEFGDELFRILPSAEEGRISTKEMLERVGLLFGISFRKLEWSDSMRRLATMNMPVVRLVNALHARYRLVLLTNVSISRYMENVEMGFFRKVECDRVYASCYLGMSKPWQEIYRYVLEKEKVAPKDVIFIDNMLVNVKGARKVGIKGIQFVGYRQLVKDLKKQGVRW